MSLAQNLYLKAQHQTGFYFLENYVKMLQVIEVKRVCSSLWETHHRATERHLPYGPYGVTQCYLPPDTGEHPCRNPSQTGQYCLNTNINIFVLSKYKKKKVIGFFLFRHCVDRRLTPEYSPFYCTLQLLRQTSDFLANQCLAEFRRLPSLFF